MQFEEDIQPCLKVMSMSGIILYPTDTIWGLGCDATDPLAVGRIFDLKQRPEAKSMIVLVADERDILKYVAEPDLRIFDYLKQVEKPTTVIYQGAIGLAENLVSSDGTIAIRVVKDTFCRHLIKRFRKPIVSTSANISGHPSPVSFHNISTQIINGVDYVVKHRQNDDSEATPSTIIRWNREGSPTVIRP